MNIRSRNDLDWSIGKYKNVFKLRSGADLESSDPI